MSVEVDLIREAATRMRTLAENTTEGRWELGTTSTVYMNGRSDFTLRAGGVPGAKGWLTLFSTDAAHMVAWDPTSGVAVAALLERAAGDYETVWDTPECPNCGEGCGGHDKHEYCARCDNEPSDCPCIQPFVTVAREFLRRDVEVAA